MNFAHVPYCNCFECTALPEDQILIKGTNHLDAMNSALQGKFIHITKPLTIYTAPDGKTVRRIAKPGGYVGKVQEINIPWITIDNQGGYIRYSNDLVFVKPDPNAVPLNTSQLTDVALNAMSEIPGGEIITTGKEVVNGANALASIDWLGDLKWIAIGIIVVLVLILAIKLT